ncbi:hypothetical protein FGO68_gene13970 [Halteria grandinella]|uniref:HECT domain-containing protein n=1 Tax=Halteria grandinella TaxID=5974 RepID=A0A8J8NIH7_HALGN|nr:hypothetical protein FGO68_gene13970 [Halteria grandinella]
MGTDQRFYWWGKNKHKHFQDADGTQDKFIQMSPECSPRLLDGKITSMASGAHFTLFVSDIGQVFARGKYFLDHMQLPVIPTAMLIPLDERYVAQRAYCTTGSKSQQVAIIDVFDKKDKLRKLLSGGKSRFGILGLGDGVKDANLFKEVKVDYKSVQFKSLDLSVRHAFAITTTGELYAWGANDYGALGLGKETSHIQYVPTKVQALGDLAIKQVSCGDFHNLVYAKVVKNGKEVEGATKVFSFGKSGNSENYYLGLTDEQVKEIKEKQKDFTGPWELKKFENCNIRHIAAGLKSSFVFTDAPKEVENMTKHVMEEDGTFAEGIMHFYYDKEGKLVQIPEAQFAKRQGDLPAVCFAIKYPIKNLATKKDKLPDISALEALLKEPTLGLTTHTDIKCTISNEDITGARYYGCPPESRGKKVYNLSQKSLFRINECDLDPVVFIRFARPIADNTVQLPVLKTEDFYEAHPTAYGLEMEIKPDYKTFISEDLISITGDLFKSKQKHFEPFNKETLRLLKDYINTMTLTSENEYTKEALKKIEEKRTAYDALTSKSDEKVSAVIDLQYVPLMHIHKDSYEVIRKIIDMQNKYFLRFMNTVTMKRLPKSIQEKYGWNQYVQLIKTEMLSHAKKKLINKMIESLKKTEEAQITVMRRKAFNFKESGQCDNEGKCTIFGQVFQQLRKENYSAFKKNRVDDKVFNVTFKGEGSQDAGGPFRDCITNMCRELQSGSLPLLIPTPNNLNNVGQFRECYLPNQSSRSPTQLEMFTCLGAMIGWSIRSTSSLNLDFPPVFWKKILGIEPDEWDLKQIDTYTWQIVQNFKTKYLGVKSISEQSLLASTTKPIKESTTQPSTSVSPQFEGVDELVSQEEQVPKSRKELEEEFEMAVDEKFTVLLNDGTEVELCPGGKKRQVTLDNLQEYVELLVSERLTRFDTQMKYIKEGISLIIPESVLFFMTWQDVDMRSTGAKTVDISTLKSITIYDTCKEDSPVVVMFWKVFATLNEDQRSKYLKFVWGRSRLPVNLDGLNRKHCIEYFKSRAKDSLPISHTCFFRIDLPDYSSEEILRKRLLYAIEYCGDIDADRAAGDIRPEEE